MVNQTFHKLLVKLYGLKKRTFFCGILAILGAFFFLAAQKKDTRLTVVPPDQTAYKAVIFDLGDVLLATSTSMHRAILIPTIIQNPWLLYELIGIDIKEAYFSILRKIPAKTSDPIYNKGKEMPQVLADWMVGCSTLPELQQITKSAISQSNNSTRMQNLFCKICECMFDQHNITNAQQPIESMVELLKKLKTAGYQVYILSNWDPFSFPMIQEKFIDIFCNCDGIMISGHEKISKPNPELFQRLLTKYSLNPQECVFIDDEPNNIKSAQELGITTIVHNNSTLTRKELIKCGILTLTAA